jgi:lipopolysaccharide/colanic/teichoic acid biosynthesis glycosyltransferase
MEEEQLTIPFDAKTLHTSALRRISHKINLAFKAFIKRIFEIVFSTVGLILLIPLTIIVAIKNVLNKDFGPIFYTQNRIGKNGKIFKMYKFRTMQKDADEALKKMLNEDEKINNEYKKYKKLKDDPRVTKTGEFLRSTGLDELPQMINVFKGQMCIVGPRPYLPDEQEEMGTYYSYIVQHKPGITGISQISGKTRMEFSERLDMDVRYHYRNNFILDLKIFLITILITLRNRNAYADIGTQVDNLAGDIAKELTLTVKRFIDIFGAIVGITLLIPITAVVATVNFFNKETGPLFYTQERIGKNGKHFKMYKFRSMVVGADEILKKMLEENEDLRKEYSINKKLKDDPRITKVGKFLRKTSIDELPQLINVLKGEMSLVGPRPYLPREKEDMGIYYDKIIESKPGITGLWQVSGRSNTTFEERMEFDLQYNEEFSASKDIEILFKTVISVVKKEGAA